MENKSCTVTCPNGSTVNMNVSIRVILSGQ